MSERQRSARRRSYAGELISNGPTMCVQDDTGGRMQQRSGLGVHEVGTERIDRALRGDVAEARSRLAAAHCGFDRDLQVLHIGGGVLVDDDEIDRETLHAPV